jgi:hypothetical protein
MRMRLLAVATAAAIVAVIAVIAPISPAQANHSWGNYHWARTSNPFTLRLDRNLTSTWYSYLNEASSDWTQSNVLNTTVATGSFGSRASCTPATGRVEVCNYTYGNTGWLGIASISITSGNHISRALVAVNDTYFNQSQYNSAPWRRLVMCQEVGHAFGLDHQDENQTNGNLGTCMDYTNNPSGPPSNEHPNSHDYSQLQSIYSHLDSFNTPASFGSFGASSLAQQSPTDWGTVVRGSVRQGQSVYLRTHANGAYTLTFVTWA